jgi:hypothetical protein
LRWTDLTLAASSSAGIHLGDVVEEADGDLMGDSVNVAARPCGSASLSWPQLYPLFAARVHPCRRRAVERIYLERLDHGDVEDGATSGGARTKNLAEKTAALSEKRSRYQAMLAQLERTRQGPDTANRSRQPRHGRAYQGRRWLQHPGPRRREEQAERQAGGDQPGRRHGPAEGDRRTGREILDVETIEVVADRGYFKAEDIEACEKVGCVPRIPRPQRGASVREGFFRKDGFRYDVLTPTRHGRLRDLGKVDYGNRGVCRDCPMRARCTNDDRMAKRLKKRPEILDRGREVVEHPSAASSSGCIRAPS